MSTNIKVGDKIYYYFRQFKDGSGDSSKETIVTDEIFNVIAVNEQLFVMDDEKFTTISHGDLWSPVQSVNESLVLFKEADSYFGNSITYYMYSTKKLDTADIKWDITSRVQSVNAVLLLNF